MKLNSFFVFIALTITLFTALGLESIGAQQSAGSFDFMGLRLGMTQDEARSVITNGRKLKLDESRYLDLMNEAYPFTIKAAYFPYIDKVYIDFFRGRSYQLTFQMNTQYFDYLTLASALEQKYGAPTQRTSRFVRWYNSTNAAPNIRLTLEYPATVKIYDYKVMLELHTELSQLIRMMTNETVDRRLIRDILSNF